MKAKQKLWKVLIVDDQEEWVKCYEDWLKYLVEKLDLSKCIDQEIKLAYGGEEALQIIEKDQDINIIITDMFMPPNCKSGYAPDDPNQPFGGIWLLKKIYEGHTGRNIQCLLISNKDDAKKYEKRWLSTESHMAELYRFVEKSADINKFKDELWNRTYVAFGEIAGISKVLHANGEIDFVISKSPKMREVFEVIDNASDTPATILILGESGTGKERVANYAHLKSDRKAKPLVVINCSGIPETLLESQLFGYESGAFTGAKRSLKGLCEKARGGTLFFDEIGDFSLSLQPKILRLLQEKSFEPLGSNKTEVIDVRFIAATNRNLREMVKVKEFREDLFYRLNVIPVTLPPLRQRQEDILPLINHFVEKFNTELNRSVNLSIETKTEMLSYNWPGNVRQLENLILRAVIMKKESVIIDEIRREAQDDDSQPALIPPIPPEGIDFNEHIKAYTRKFAKAILKQANDNRKEAAKLLNVSDRTFTRYLTGK